MERRRRLELCCEPESEQLSCYSAVSGGCLHEQPEEEQGVDLTAAAPWRPGGEEGGWREVEEGGGGERKRWRRRSGKEEVICACVRACMCIYIY